LPAINVIPERDHRTGLGESGNDLLRELPDFAMVVGDLREIDNHILDAHGLKLLDAHTDLIGRTDQEVLFELFPRSPRRYGGLPWIFTIRQQVHVATRRFGDFAIVAAFVLAMSREDVEFHFRDVWFAAANVASVTVLRDEAERHFLAASTDQKRAVFARPWAL
jgi:hypothetical protein